MQFLPSITGPIAFRYSLAEEFSEHYEEAKVQCSLALKSLRQELQLCAKGDNWTHIASNYNIGEVEIYLGILVLH